MALTGIGLVLFVVVHLLGNLALYKSDPLPFNKYANSLQGFGLLLEIAEIGLLLVIVVHVVVAIALKLNHWAARPERYRMWKSKGGDTPSNVSSRSMIYSGILILAFLVIHVAQFHFGAGIEQGYVTQVHGENVRDLYRLVNETFKNPAWVGFYVICMLLLGTHLRHGIWSAFQSLGIVRGTASKKLLCLSAFLGFILAVGFLFIPVWIYFFR